MIMQLDGYERILYRTHTVILTDKRLIVDGNTYPLWQIDAVRTVRAWYYYGLQVLRLVVLIAALYAVFHLLNPPEADPGTSTILLRVFFLVILGGLFFLLVWAVPTHVLRAEGTGHSIRVMTSGDVELLRDFADQIEDARAGLRTDSADPVPAKANNPVANSHAG